MPLSKKRNKDRMRLIRLHKHFSPLTESNPVQPSRDVPWFDQPGYLVADHDADGYPIYEE